MDGATYRWVNRLADNTHWAHGLFRFNAKVGIVAFAVLLLAAVWVSRTKPAPARALGGAVWAGGAALVGLAVNQLIGHLVQRPRPYVAMPHAHVLISRTTDFSFPSDHACVAGAVAAGLVLVDRRLGVIAAALAVVMAFSRVYVGAHYPGDVIAGLAVGAVVAFVLAPTARRLLEPAATQVGRRLPWLLGQSRQTRPQ